MSVRVRFAPSPTGKLHVGNVRTALINMLYARKHGGQLVLRFEDTDLEREVPEAEKTMLTDFDWLGLTPDESTVHGGDFGPYRTRERAENGDYQKALKTLFDKDLAYECFVSKDELDMIRRMRTSRGLPPGYDNRHRDLSEEEKEKYRAEGREPVIRFKLLDGEIVFNDLVRGEVKYDAKNLGGDPVIVRSNGIPTFTFAGAVDDINQKITHVIRGEDHVTNAAAQVRIFEALGADVPTFAHMPMLLDSDGGKLSKRLDSLSIEQLREQGYMAEAIVSYLAALGTSVDPKIAPLEELAAQFEFSSMGRAPVRFDLDQVMRLNSQILHEMPFDQARPYLDKYLPKHTLPEPELQAFWDAVRPNLRRFDEVAEQFRLCFDDLDVAMLEGEDADYIKLAAEKLPAGPYNENTWQEWVSTLKEESGRKGKGLFMPLRLALTGMQHGPELANLLPVIGEERARERLKKAAN